MSTPALSDFFAEENEHDADPCAEENLKECLLAAGLVPWHYTYREKCIFYGRTTSGLTLHAPFENLRPRMLENVKQWHDTKGRALSLKTRLRLAAAYAGEADDHVEAKSTLAQVTHQLGFTSPAGNCSAPY